MYIFYLKSRVRDFDVIGTICPWKE